MDVWRIRMTELGWMQVDAIKEILGRVEFSVVRRILVPRTLPKTYKGDLSLEC